MIIMKKYNEILLSLGIGLAVGGILGVLFAPDKGSETRRKISESGSNLKKGLKDKVNLTKQKVNQLKDEFAESINGLDNSTNDYI
jgi:gas vesicle protein